MKITPDTSLSAGESPEGTGNKVAEPVSTTPATAKPVLHSATLAAGPADASIPPIPAVDLTAEALTRYLREHSNPELLVDFQWSNE